MAPNAHDGSGFSTEGGDVPLTASTKRYVVIKKLRSRNDKTGIMEDRASKRTVFQVASTSKASTDQAAFHQSS